MWNTHFRAAALAAFAIYTTACDSGQPSRTADELAADSALAADLALANRDTLLVDSIGAYREPDAAERDTTTPVVAPAPASAPATVREQARFGDVVGSGSTAPKATAPAPVVEAPQPSTPAVTPPAPVNTAPATTTAPKPAAAAPKLSGTRACSSPTQENQSECIRVSIAASDARLNRIYRALITEMRRQEKVAPGAKDPPSVQRLRVSQRAWVVYRDTECRKRGRGNEGALWARPRARCLADFAGRRANELADNFVKLTAH
jgi:uncharacterized protein YecT (DUF1311 family)